jgi:hypothetical protein
MTKVTHISFHDNKAKRMFIEENGIGQNEIVSDGIAYIVLQETINGEAIDWTLNGWVYSVEVL